MSLEGICQCCGKLSSNLKTCMYCGARVCNNCLDPQSGGCKLCKGRVTQK